MKSHRGEPSGPATPVVPSLPLPGSRTWPPGPCPRQLSSDARHRLVPSSSAFPGSEFLGPCGAEPLWDAWQGLLPGLTRGRALWSATRSHSPTCPTRQTPTDNAGLDLSPDVKIRRWLTCRSGCRGLTAVFRLPKGELEKRMRE